MTLSGERAAELLTRAAEAIAKELSPSTVALSLWQDTMRPKEGGNVNYTPPAAVTSIIGNDVSLDEVRDLLKPFLEKYLAQLFGARSVSITW